jgi:hypothetical protein
MTRSVKPEHSIGARPTGSLTNHQDIHIADICAVPTLSKRAAPDEPIGGSRACPYQKATTLRDGMRSRARRPGARHKPSAMDGKAPTGICRAPASSYRDASAARVIMPSFWGWPCARYAADEDAAEGKSRLRPGIGWVRQSSSRSQWIEVYIQRPADQRGGS